MDDERSEEREPVGRFPGQTVWISASVVVLVDLGVVTEAEEASLTVTHPSRLQRKMTTTKEAQTSLVVPASPPDCPSELPRGLVDHDPLLPHCSPLNWATVVCLSILEIVQVGWVGSL